MLYGNNLTRFSSNTGHSDGYSVVVLILQLAGCKLVVGPKSIHTVHTRTPKP